MSRIILHMDLDSFYASAEEIRHPEIKGKPIVICVFSGRSADSGAVATANYLARKFGIKAGMPIVNAKRAAKEGTVFLARDMDYYRDLSERIMQLIEDDCDVLEQASIDEAYLDVTIISSGSWDNAKKIAEVIKKKILEETGLTCSIGIGPNKLIAKMAGKIKKPDGLSAVKEKDVGDFMINRDVADIFGIGVKTIEILNRIGIKTAKDLANANPIVLIENFGKNKSILLANKARGIDDSPVEPRVMKQLSKIGTLSEDSSDMKKIGQKLEDLSIELGTRAKKMGALYQTVSLIAIDSSLNMQTRSKSIEETDDIKIAAALAKELLEKYLAEHPEKKLRRIGISISNLAYKKEQKSLGDFYSMPNK